MKHIITSVVLLSLTFYCCSDNPITPHDYGQGDDYEIYRVALGDDLDSSEDLIILGDSTGTSIMNSDSISIAYFKGHLRDLQDETFYDFVSTNKNRIKLKYVSGVDHLVLSGDYRDSSNENVVHVGLSRVGYNDSRTQAVVELGASSAPLAGSGTLFLLAKEDGKWVIKGRCMTWIS